MIRQVVISFLLCTLIVGRAFSEVPDCQAPRLSKDGKFYPLPPQPTRPPLTKEQQQLEDEANASSNGIIFVPSSPLPCGAIEHFELPFDQLLEYCSYAAGYTFPDICSDQKGNVIFRAGVDPQAVLDDLKAAQGIKGEYNIVPPGYTVDSDDGSDDPLSPEDEAAIEAQKDADDGWSGYPREKFDAGPPSDGQ